MINDKDIVLKTERMYLRHFNEEDFDNLYLLVSNKSVMRYFPEILDMEKTRALLAAIIKHYELYGYCFWAASLKKTYFS